MASDFRVTVNHAAAEQILKGQVGTVVQAMEALGERVLAATGQPDEYSAETWVGVNRARHSLVTKTAKARSDEATDHTLVRALGSVQGG